MGEVESLKIEVRKKARKVPLPEIWEEVVDSVVTVYSTCELD